MQNRQELVVSTGWLRLRRYRVCQKRENVPKISENPRFQLSHLAMPPSGDAAEKFNIGAQVHSFQYAVA